VKMKEILQVLFQKFIEVQREKIDFSSVCKSLIRGGKWKWVGGLFTFKCIQLACVNSPFFKAENNIGKLVFCRDVSHSPKLVICRGILMLFMGFVIS
jgi:hypothetical protein